MKTPKGFELDNKGDTSEHVLELHKNVYGKKKAGIVCYQHLARKITKELGLTHSTVENYVFYRGRILYALYTDNSILVGPYQKKIDHIIEDLKKVKLLLAVEGDLQVFLGFNI